MTQLREVTEKNNTNRVETERREVICQKKIFKVSGEEFRKQYKEAYESGRASLADKMPAEFFARTAISDEVAVLLFRYMSFLDEADKTTCRYLQEVKN